MHSPTVVCGTYNYSFFSFSISSVIGYFFFQNVIFNAKRIAFQAVRIDQAQALHLDVWVQQTSNWQNGSLQFRARSLLVTTLKQLLDILDIKYKMPVQKIELSTTDDGDSGSLIKEVLASSSSSSSTTAGNDSVQQPSWAGGQALSSRQQPSNTVKQRKGSHAKKVL